MTTTDDAQAPATKQDIAMLIEYIGSYEIQFEQIDQRFEEVDRRFDEVIDQFHLAVETIRFELLGANRDEIEVIKDRISRLERHPKLRAA